MIQARTLQCSTRRISLGGILTTFLLVLLAGSSEAQDAGSAAVRGRVLSNEGRPLAAATVSLSQPTRTHETVTDTLGGFRFARIGTGMYLLQVRRVGFAPEMMTFAVSGRDTAVTIRLTAIPASLDTVRVLAPGVAPARYGPSSRMDEFYQRKQSGRGRFFTRDDIVAAGHSDMAPLFSSVPGSRVRTYPNGDMTVRFARCQGVGGTKRAPSTLSGGGGRVPAEDLPGMASSSELNAMSLVAVYVNGARVAPSHAAETLGSLRQADVEAIEVYRGPAELPAEAVGNACAAIFIWTRFGAAPRDSVRE